MNAYAVGKIMEDLNGNIRCGGPNRIYGSKDALITQLVNGLLRRSIQLYVWIRYAVRSGAVMIAARCADQIVVVYSALG